MMKSRPKIRIAPRVVLIFLLFLVTDRSGLVFVTLLAAFFHELGHILAARMLHIPFRRMRIDLMGARLEIGGRMLSYREEWILAVSGPLASFLVAAVGVIFWKWTELSVYFSCASLLLGGLNLLPIRSFDGGRMLEASVAAFAGTRMAYRVITLSSFFCLFLLWAVSVYFLLRVGDGISLFFFSLSLFLRFFEREKL